jgi:phosphoribosylanthranilate isomerase
MTARRLFVKVCGITSEEDAGLAVEAGADAVGLVFWPKSPRASASKRRDGSQRPYRHRSCASGCS